MPFSGRLNLKLYERDEFEVLNEETPKALKLSDANVAIIARNSLRLLMMGWPTTSWKEIISWHLVNALFLQRDPILLKALRRAFQDGFDYLYLQLKDKEFLTEDHEQIHLFLSNCLSVLPICDLTPYEAVRVPQFVNNTWELVDYAVCPIELTPTQGLHRLLLNDNDRVFAYGFEPLYQKKAQPHLVFMGTTYPAGQGFIPQVASDFKGFNSVGSSLYQDGRESIKQWLNKQTSKVHVCGISLGGSMALLLAIDLGGCLSRVDALNPPGLHASWWKDHYDSWDNMTDKPMVVVQQQGNDPVSLFGVWKEDWVILQVSPPKNKQGPNLFCDHFMNYAGIEGTVFNTISPAEDNLRRGQRNFWIFSLARACLYCTTIIPLRYLLLPILYFVFEYKYNVPKGILYSTLNLVRSITGLIKDFDPAKLHDLTSLRNEEMDIYNPHYVKDMALTKSQLNTYYWVTRCLVKQKQPLPAETRSTKHNEELSKRDLLMACQAHVNEKMIYKATRAKAKHIHETLRLTQTLGLENIEVLQKALLINHSQYLSGKSLFKKEENKVQFTAKSKDVNICIL